jgi:hypothetical protein
MNHLKNQNQDFQNPSPCEWFLKNYFTLYTGYRKCIGS